MNVLDVACLIVAFAGAHSFRSIRLLENSGKISLISGKNSPCPRGVTSREMHAGGRHDAMCAARGYFLTSCVLDFDFISALGSRLPQ